MTSVATGSAVLVRRPVAFIVTRFPSATEAFVVEEIDEIERHAQPLLLVPLVREHPAAIDDEMRSWIARAYFTPWISVAIVRSCLRALVRKPGVLLRQLASIFAAVFRPRTLIPSLLLFPKAVHLAEVFEKEGIGHIHAQRAGHPATVARIASALSGISFSFTAHGNDVYAARALLRGKVRDARFIRSVSQFNRQLLDALYPSESGRKIHVVHGGVDVDAYARPEGGTPPRGELPRLLYAGALEPHKGTLFLVEACRILAQEGVPFRCDIIGRGHMRGAIRRAIVKGGLHDRVRLHGELPHRRVIEQMRSADVFVLAGVIAADHRMDGMPMALLEAMAAGKAVVATALSGISEVIVDGANGVLVDPGNPRMLAGAIRRLIENPALREQLGRGARERVANAFDLRLCTKSLLEFFDLHNEPAAEDVIDALLPFAKEGTSYGVRHVRRGIDSNVVELACLNGTAAKEIVLKQHLHRDGESRAPQVRAVEEARLLERLEPHFASAPTLGVPRPIALDEASGTVIMARAPGVPLTKLIRDARDGRSVDGEALRAGARGAGAWLYRFQQVEQGSGGPVIEAIASRALEQARSLRGRRRIEMQIRDLRRRLHERQLRAVAHHGDFWPGNVFVAGDRVEVIDFEGYGLSLAAHDVAYFFLHASLYFRWRNAKWIEELRESFFAGYEGLLDPAELELCRLAVALQFAAKPSARGPLERLVRRAVIRRELSR